MQKLSELYPNQVNTGGAGHPHGAPRNVEINGDGSGFPLEKSWILDVFGGLYSLLDAAGIEPNGSEEKIGDSQILTAVEQLIRERWRFSNHSGSTLGSSLELSREHTYIYNPIAANCDISMPSLGAQLLQCTVHIQELPADTRLRFKMGAGPTILEVRNEFESLKGLDLNFVRRVTTDLWHHAAPVQPRQRSTYVLSSAPVDGSDFVSVPASRYGAMRCAFDIPKEGPQNGPVGEYPDGALQIDIGPPIAEGEEFICRFDGCKLYPDWLLNFHADGQSVTSSNAGQSMVNGWQRSFGSTGYGGAGYAFRFRVMDGLWRYCDFG